MKWHYTKQLFLCLCVIGVWFSGYYTGRRACPEYQARRLVEEQQSAREKQEVMRVLIATLETMLAESQRNTSTNQ